MHAPVERELETRWAEIERKHELQCLWSEVIGNRTIQTECLFFPRVGVTVIVTKHFDHPIPRSYTSKKPFPKLIGVYVYYPIGGHTWDELDQALATMQKAE